MLLCSYNKETTANYNFKNFPDIHLTRLWISKMCLLFFYFFFQRQIYGHKGKNIDIFADSSSLAVNSHHIRSLLDLLSRTPRVAPFLSKNDPFLGALKKVFFILYLLKNITLVVKSGSIHSEYWPWSLVLYL